MKRRLFLGSAALASGVLSMKGDSHSATDVSAVKIRPLDGIERDNITITDVRVTLLSYKIPPEKQWMSSTFLVTKTDCALVEVFTDKGIVGIGEPSPYGGMVEMKKYIESVIKPAVIGMNPFDVDFITCGGTDFMRRCAWAGVNVALWDSIGKVKDMPVYRLLATDCKPDPHIRMYASGGVEYAWYKRPEDLIDEAVRSKESGYTAYKFRLGTEWKNSGITVRKFIPYLEKMRQAVGYDFDLMQESNMRLTLEECLELCPVLEELKFHWFEEPIGRFKEGAIEGYIKINEALPTVLVSGGETMTNRFEFREWIDRGAYEIVQPDMNTTGISEGWQIARMANLKGRYCCPHNWHGGLTTMANAHLVAGIPNRHMLELNQTFNPFKEEIFREPLVVKKGYMDLTDKPGYGVAVLPDLEKKYPYIEGSYAMTNPYLPK